MRVSFADSHHQEQVTMNNDQGGDVAIFWDYENCHPPSTLSGYEIVQKLRYIGHKFGTIKLFKAYFELSDPVGFSKSMTLRSELQCSGVSLTDCPHNGRKDVADKMIMVDMLAYAIDNPAPSTIILISGDRDFAYAVSILRLRRYRVVIVSLSGIHASLKAQASVFIDWATDVLNAEAIEESSCLREELRPTLISPVESVMEKKSSHKLQRGQWTVKEEVDLMTLTAARSLSKSKLASVIPAPVPMTPHICTNQIADSPSSVLADEDDLSPSCSLGTPVKSTSTPPTVVNSDDYVDITEVQATQGIPLKQVASELKAGPSLHKVGSPQQKPAAKLDNAVVLPLTDHPPNVTKPTVFPASNAEALVQSTPSMTLITPYEAKIEPMPTLPEPNLVVPDKFRILIHKLQLRRAKGTTRPLRSVIGLDLSAKNNEVYRNAGVKHFSQYMALAKKEGIIELGGHDGGAWVSLCPAWHAVKLS